MAIDVIMTINGNGDTASAIQESPAYAGMESSKTWPFKSRPYFLDYPFTDDSASFDDHLQKVKALKPRLTVAPDVEKGRTLAEVASMADELLEYADDVIIVPKDCHPSEIPDRFRAGITVGEFGSMAPWSVWDYRNNKSIHILGGTPRDQIAVISHGLDVKSVDSYTLGVRAQYGMWDGKAIDAPDGWDYQKRLKESLNNYVTVINEL